MTQISRINRMTDMKQIFRIFTLIAVAVLTAGQAWAGSYNGVVNTNVTGGELTLSYQEGTADPVAVTVGVTDVPAGATVTIVAGPSLGYTLKDFDIIVQSTTGSGNAEARSFTRGNDPGIGQTITVSPVENAPGIYTFAMPDGDNVLVSATFKEKPYLGDGTNAHISYYSYDAQGNRVTLNTGDDGHPRVYILDGTETELGQSDGTVWYVSTTQTYNRSLTVLGTVGLILRDGTTMTVSHSSDATATISGAADASLTTYGQSAGTGRLAVSNADGTAISVGAFSILGTGVAISNSTQGISTAANGTLRLAILPTFGSGTAKNGCDIFLSAGTVIDIAADITAAPQQPVTVGFGEGYTAPFSFTNGYGAHCHYATGTNAGEVIAVGEMFTSSTQLEDYQAIVYGDGREYSSSETYVPGEASLINDTESTTPSVVATVTNAKGTVEYFFGTDQYDSHFRGAVLAANAATSDVELKLCDHIDFGNNAGVTFDNTHQVTVGTVTRPVAITLELSYCQISGAGYYIIYINEGTSLTIQKHSEAERHGTIEYKGVIGEAIDNEGTLTITGGNFIYNNGEDSGTCIYNRGTLYFEGGIIHGFSDGIQNEYDGIVYVSGGIISVKEKGINNSSYEGTPQIYISGGQIFGNSQGIINCGGAVTISGGTIEAGNETEGLSGTAIYSTNGGTLTFEAQPAINVEGTGSKDIYLGENCIITFGSNFTVGSTFDKLKVCIDESNGPDYTFTNGYSTRVKYAAGTDKAGQVIPPAEFFDAYYDNKYDVLSSDLRMTDGGEAELFEPLYSYVDATGTLHENVQAVVLDGSETSIGYSRIVSGSSEPIMYICTTPASENNGQGLVYEGNLVLDNNVPLIIADGCKLTAPGIRGSGKTLTIYTQSGQTGQIVATTYGCNVNLAQRFVAYAPGATESDPMIATAIVSGNVTDLSAIAGKTLKPLNGYTVTLADDISLMDGTTAKTPDFTIGTTPYYIYKASTQEAPVTVTLSYDGTDFVTVGGLPEGTTLDDVENQPMQRSFAMPAEDVALTATAVTGLTASGDTYDYDGTAKTPTVKLGDDVFAATNYVVAYTKGGSAVSEAKKVGTYSCTVNGSGSYIGTIATDVAITINPKTVTVTSGISASNKTYDGTTTATLSGTNAVISGKVDGDDLSVSATGAFADKDTGSDKTVNISSITLTGNDKDNYVLASTGNQATTSANISKKDLSITADDKNVSYGDAEPTYTASYSGFVSGESESNLSGTLSFACDYTSSSNTGTYSIMPSGYTSSNYNISYNNGTLTVIAAAVDYSGGTITLDENGYDITLDEGTGSANPLPSGTIDALDYSRTLTAPGTGEGDVMIGGVAANLYTVCLPAAPMITGTAVTYYTLSSVEGTTLKFTEIDGSPAAFTPYLVAVTGNSDVVVSSCSNVSFDTNQAAINSKTVDGFTFTGTLTGLNNADARAAASSNVTYILQNAAKWGKVVSGSVYLPPFRAFIVGPVLAAGARELSSSFDDGNATAIERIVTTDRDGTEHWYDMNGRRIERPTTKGVYILNGRKEVIK